MAKWNPNLYTPQSIELLQRPVTDNFCSVDEAAKRLDVSNRMVRYLIQEGWLYGSMQIGGTWLVCKVSLDAYIEKHIQDKKYLEEKSQ